MKRFLAIALCLALLGLVGCGGYQTGVRQKATVSAIELTGNYAGATLVIDNGQPLSLDKIHRYELAPGKHTIQVFRGDRLLVNRVLFLSNDQTTEVRVP